MWIPTFVILSFIFSLAALALSISAVVRINKKDTVTV